MVLLIVFLNLRFVQVSSTIPFEFSVHVPAYSTSWWGFIRDNCLFNCTSHWWGFLQIIRKLQKIDGCKWNACVLPPIFETLMSSSWGNDLNVVHSSIQTDTERRLVSDYTGEAPIGYYFSRALSIGTAKEGIKMFIRLWGTTVVGMTCYLDYAIYESNPFLIMPSSSKVINKWCWPNYRDL